MTLPILIGTHMCPAHATVWEPGSLWDMWSRRGTAALQSCFLSPHVVESYEMPLEFGVYLVLLPQVTVGLYPCLQSPVVISKALPARSCVCETPVIWCRVGLWAPRKTSSHFVNKRAFLHFWADQPWWQLCWQIWAPSDGSPSQDQRADFRRVPASKEERMFPEWSECALYLLKGPPEALPQNVLKQWQCFRINILALSLEKELWKHTPPRVPWALGSSTVKSHVLRSLWTSGLHRLHFSSEFSRFSTKRVLSKCC